MTELRGVAPGIAYAGTMYRCRRLITSMIASAPAVLLGSLQACRSPTEVSLDLSTDVPCAAFSGAAISVGTQASVETKAPATTTTTCSGAGTIGSLVIVPSGSTDEEITLRVAGGVGRDPETCTDDAADFTGCIVSRRAVRFIDHTPLTLEVPLRASCIGVVCPELQTCARGACVSDAVPTACGTAGEACGEEQLDLDAGTARDASLDATTLDAADGAAPESGTSDGGPFGSTDGAPDVTTVDAADGSVTSVPPVCLDGTAPGALWPVTGRCSSHDSHTTLVGVTAGTVACTAGSGAAEAPLAIDAAGQLYTGDASGVLRVYDENLVRAATYSIGRGQITSVAIASATVIYVASATAISRLTLPEAAMVIAPQSQAPLPLLVASNGDLVTGDGVTINAYGAAFPRTAWTYAPAKESANPIPFAVAAVPTGGLLGSWQNEGELYPLNDDGVAGDSLPSDEPTGALVLANGRAYTWNQPGLALENGAESDIAGIVGVALTSSAIAVTSNPTNQIGMVSLFDPVTIKPKVQVALPQGTTVVSAPAVDGNDTVYFLTSDGKLHVRTAAGIDTPLDATGISAVSAPPPIIGRGVVYVGGLGAGGICMYK